MVERVIREYLRPFGEQLTSHNAVANCLDLIQMLQMATDDPDPNASSIARRRWFEARRQLAIAFQLFGIEEVDPEIGVARDLAEIDRLSWERLFSEESQDIRILAGLPRADGRKNRVRSVHISTSHKDHAQTVRRLRNSGRFKDLILPCRVAVIQERKYVVYVVDRRKGLFPTLLKLERGRSAGDRRGWKYVVVAIQQEEGGLRLASREDVLIFSQYTCEALWKDPLVPYGSKAEKFNPHSHKDYWDEKIAGRFFRKDGGRVFVASAEQITTTLIDFLHTLLSRDGVNHQVYRGDQILEHLAPIWFPFKGGPFEKGLPIPNYGVDWGSRYVRQQLEKWWQMSL